MDADGSSDERENKKLGGSIGKKLQDKGKQPALPEQPEVGRLEETPANIGPLPATEGTENNAGLSLTTGPPPGNDSEVQEEPLVPPPSKLATLVEPDIVKITSEVLTSAVPEPIAPSSLPAAQSTIIPEKAGANTSLHTTSEEHLATLAPQLVPPLEPVTHEAQQDLTVETPSGSPFMDAPLTPLPEGYGSDDDAAPRQSKCTITEARGAKLGPLLKRAKKMTAVKKGKGGVQMKASTSAPPATESADK